MATPKIILLVALATLFSGCGGTTPPPKLPEEEPIQPERKAEPKALPKDADDPVDVTDPAQNAGPPGKTTPSARPQPLLPAETEAPEKPASGKPGKKGEKITSGDCARMIDHYLDLVVSSDPRFADLGPEAGNMVRQVASQDPTYQKAQKDCTTDLTRRKFDCALGARTPSAWQACVK